jgi:hypothetical protein
MEFDSIDSVPAITIPFRIARAPHLRCHQPPVMSSSLKPLMFSNDPVIL